MTQLWTFRHDVAGAVVYWSGAGRVFEVAARPAGAIILMYHSVATDDAAEFVDPPNRIWPALFEKQMAFLSAHRRVVPLSQVVEQIGAGVSPPAGTVCVTFDDGYLDNLAVAAPILARYRLPATLFLATGYVERGETQWADVLHGMIHRRTSDRLHLPTLGGASFDLATAAGRRNAREMLHPHLLEAGPEERARLLAETGEQLKPAGRSPRLTMNWDDVRELCRRYPRFEIGGHTRDHVDLRTHRGAIARSQIAGCAADLRRELGEEPRHFSFPYARWCAESRDIVSASGWSSAVGMGPGFRIAASSDRFAMPRVESPRTMTELRFKTSGAYPGALALLGIG